MVRLDKKPVKQKPGMKGPFCCWKARTLGMWNFFNYGASPFLFLQLGGGFWSRLHWLLFLIRHWAGHFPQALEERLNCRGDGERWCRRSRCYAPDRAPTSTSSTTGKNQAPSSTSTTATTAITATPIQTTMP